MPEPEYWQIVRIRLRDEAAESALLDARPRFVDAFRELFPELIEARLVRVKTGLYIDTWRWRTREAAERAFERREEVHGYREWDALVEILAFDQGELVAGGAG